MSTVPYGPNDMYKIGIMKREGKGIKNIETGEENDISLFNRLVPTYGAWAGPEWAGDVRAPRGTPINWSHDPCFNEAIKYCGDPEYMDPITNKKNKEKCFSLVDAMAKHHDWDYEVAEHNSAQEASLKMTADKELLNSIALAEQNNGAYTYDCDNSGDIMEFSDNSGDIMEFSRH